MSVQYLLDTTILLHWTREKSQASELERQFELTASPLRPLICEVSLGEMLAFSRSLKWGPEKRKRLSEIERHVVKVPISDRHVLDAYAELSTLAHEKGWSIFHGKNDLWVGAAAKATDSHLLTTDRDFLPLRSLPPWRVTVLHEKTALPLP